MIDFEMRLHRQGMWKLPVLVWQLGRPIWTISTAPHGGGLGPRRWIINAQLPPGCAGRDLDDRLAQLGISLGLSGEGVGMLTIGDVRHLWRGREGGVEVVVTVSVEQATPAAGSNGPATVAPSVSANVLAVLPEPVCDAALVNAVTTVAEARVETLWDAGLVATAPSSDAISILCHGHGERRSSGRSHSRWEPALARAVRTAVAAAAAADVMAGGALGHEEDCG